MVFLWFWVVFGLILGCVWPQGWAIDWIQSLIGECIAVIFHGHLRIWQQRFQVSDGLLVLLNAVLRFSDKLLDVLDDLLLLLVNRGGDGVSWVWNLQGFILLLEAVNHSGDWNFVLVCRPVNLRWSFRVGDNTKRCTVQRYIRKLSAENCYLIKI
jgi:hypothetical protein